LVWWRQLRYSKSFIPFVRGAEANYKMSSVSSLLKDDSHYVFLFSKCRSNCNISLPCPGCVTIILTVYILDYNFPFIKLFQIVGMQQKKI
jgi:hypothetical protein